MPNSAANPSQAAAAACIGPEPAPLKMSAELTSGGNTKKFIRSALFFSWTVRPYKESPFYICDYVNLRAESVCGVA